MTQHTAPPWPGPPPEPASMRLLTATPARPESGSEALSTSQGEALVRLFEASRSVVRRYQFFGWTQGHLHGLLPHLGLVCGHWQRGRSSLIFEAFHNVVISPASLAALTDSHGPFLTNVTAAWVDGRGRALLLGLPYFLGDSAPAAQHLHAELGDTRLLVHGVSRPARPQELETFYLLLTPPGSPAGAQSLRLLELVLPYLHSVWLRVLTTEAELNLAPSLPPPAERALRSRPVAEDGQPVLGAGVTARERQILSWVREGKSNQQIGEVLGISPLTVKNHLQKILRKLGASNRTQAVAMAMQKNLLDSAP